MRVCPNCGYIEYETNLDDITCENCHSNELKRELSKFPDGKDVEFTLRAFSNGFYSDLWEWEFAEEKKENTPCTHEWVNVSFTSVNMACKHCDQSAPWWIQNKHDPQAR